MNREGFARKATWRRFPVLGCKGAGGGRGEVPIQEKCPKAHSD